MPAPTPISTTTVDVANAVVAEINAPVAGTVWVDQATGFSCTRKWLPKYTDDELSTLRIAVIAGQEEDERTARNIVAREHTVTLWLQKKVADPTPAAMETEVDGLASFAYQIKDYFIAQGRVLATLANVYCMRASVRASHSPKDLDERSLWVAVIDLEFHERTRQ